MLIRYLHHRVLQYLLVGAKDPYPIPHPVVEHALCMSLTYEQIKGRFEFVIKTGVRSTEVLSGADAKKMVASGGRKLNFETLLLTETEVFLKNMAPGVSEEEYDVFERYINDNPDDEDDTITQIAELEAQGYSNQDIDRNIKKVSKFSSKYGQKNEEREELEYKFRHIKLTD